MRARWLVFALTLTVFASGCTNPFASELECPPKYILAGGACCLDFDANGVCDNDEGVTTTAKQTTVPTTVKASTSVRATTSVEETTSTVEGACSKSSECGVGFHSTMTCDSSSNSIVTSLNEPVCRLGKCTYRSERVVIYRCGNNKYCKPGNGCVKADEPTVDVEHTGAVHVTSQDFNEGIKGYEFKLAEYVYKGMVEPVGMRLLVSDADGVESEVVIQQDVVTTGDLEILRWLKGSDDEAEHGLAWGTIYVLDHTQRAEEAGLKVCRKGELC